MFAEKSGRSPQKYCSVIGKLIQLKINVSLICPHNPTLSPCFRKQQPKRSRHILSSGFFYKILNIGPFLWLVCGCLIAILLTSFSGGYWWSGGGEVILTLFCFYCFEFSVCSHFVIFSKSMLVLLSLLQQLREYAPLSYFPPPSFIKRPLLNRN